MNTVMLTRGPILGMGRRAMYRDYHPQSMFINHYSVKGLHNILATLHMQLILKCNYNNYYTHIHALMLTLNGTNNGYWTTTIGYSSYIKFHACSPHEN